MISIELVCEKNGAIFYRDAAKQVSVEKYKDFLLELAAMEDKHKKTFAAMRAELSGTEAEPLVFDPDEHTIVCRPIDGECRK